MIHTAGIFIVDKNLNILICAPYGGVQLSRGYTVPKGKKEAGEELIDAAIRETLEESGFDVTEFKKKLKPLGFTKYKKRGKKFHGFLLEIDIDLTDIEFKCNSFIDDDPEKPEIHMYKIVGLDDAVNKLHYTQAEQLKKIAKKIKNRERYAKIQQRKKKKREESGT